MRILRPGRAAATRSSLASLVPLLIAGTAAAQATGAPAALDGVWTVTIHQEPMDLVVPMTFRSERGGGWEAFSRAGAAGDLVGRTRSVLGGIAG
ncbi:MAG TPA: hypothetical protein VFH27_00905, partial [Longimicrobiaceae bacterium]|nr:hypothetical protein [Longimicrobiaceae bacterium]